MLTSWRALTFGRLVSAGVDIGWRYIVRHGGGPRLHLDRICCQVRVICTVSECCGVSSIWRLSILSLDREIGRAGAVLAGPDR